MDYSGEKKERGVVHLAHIKWQKRNVFPILQLGHICVYVWSRVHNLSTITIFESEVKLHETLSEASTGTERRLPLRVLKLDSDSQDKFIAALL